MPATVGVVSAATERIRPQQVPSAANVEVTRASASARNALAWRETARYADSWGQPCEKVPSNMKPAVLTGRVPPRLDRVTCRLKRDRSERLPSLKRTSAVAFVKLLGIRV
jgi:hypothetical protein